MVSTDLDSIPSPLHRVVANISNPARCIGDLLIFSIKIRSRLFSEMNANRPDVGSSQVITAERWPLRVKLLPKPL
jgi:hypothetical protein